MIKFFSHQFRHVQATVEEVLPSTGLAYLTDDDAVSWAVTRSMPGVGVSQLSPGQRLDLEIEQHGSFSVVSSYSALD